MLSPWLCSCPNCKSLLLMHHLFPFIAECINIASAVIRVRCRHSICAAGTAEQAGFFCTTGQKARNQQTKYECTRVKLDRFMVCSIVVSHHQFAYKVLLAGSTKFHSDLNCIRTLKQCTECLPCEAQHTSSTAFQLHHHMQDIAKPTPNFWAVASVCDLCLPSNFQCLSNSPTCR